MSIKERQDKIMSILKQKKVVSTRNLEQLIYSSPSTLRRDLLELETQGRIIREHGKIRLTLPKNTDYSFDSRLDDKVTQKKLIAEIASTFIGHNQAIFLDSSSTVSFLLPYLSKIDGLHVITNSVTLPALINEMSNISLFIAGGEIANDTNSILGNFAVDFLNNFYTDITFISCRGLDESCTYEANYNQALIKRKMIKNSKKTVLMVDSSKFSSRHFFKLTNFTKIDYIITDKQPREDLLTELEKKCEVIWPDNL